MAQSEYGKKLEDAVKAYAAIKQQVESSSLFTGDPTKRVWRNRDTHAVALVERYKKAHHDLEMIGVTVPSILDGVVVGNHTSPIDGLLKEYFGSDLRLTNSICFYEESGKVTYVGIIYNLQLESLCLHGRIELLKLIGLKGSLGWSICDNENLWTIIKLGERGNYREALSRRAEQSAIFLHDDLLELIFAPLEKRILTFYNQYFKMKPD